MNSQPETRLGPLPPGQFRIFASASAYAQQEATGAARRLQIDRFTVECGEFLRTTILNNRKGEVVGVVLGHAFVVDTGERLSSKHCDELEIANINQDVFEILYERLFGAFIIIFMVDQKCCLYLDASGCLSAVYSEELEIAGSTAGAVLSPEDYEARFQKQMYAELDVVHEGWFPAGLTAHRGVSRLLCNHRLDLAAASPGRHWPTEAPRRSESESEALALLTSAIRNNLYICFDNFSAALSLTGGGDSRALLSLMRDRPSQIVTYVVVADEDGKDREVYLSNMLARKFGFEHRVLSPLNANPESERRWHFRCGHAIGGFNAKIYTALARLDDREAIVDGMGAEIARCFFWKNSDTVHTQVTGETIWRRFGIPLHAEVIGAVERWLERAPKGDSFFTLDLAYLELRSSAWGYAQSYVDPPLLHLSPYVSRRTFTAMFQLPIATKLSGAFPREIIRTNWPELLAVPINSYGDARDWLRAARRATDFRLVRKKLRKIFAP